MRRIPTYIVTGFLGSGKTTLIDEITSSSSKSCLVLQFELGEKEFIKENKNREIKTFSSKNFAQVIKEKVEEISALIQQKAYEEVWIEWNGILEFSDLEKLLFHEEIEDLLSIKKVIYMSDALEEESLLQGTGGSLFSQLSSSDIGVLKDRGSQQEKKEGKNLLKKVSKGISVFEASKVEELEEDFYRALNKKKRGSYEGVALISLGFFLLLTSLSTLGEMGNLMAKVFSVFLGTFLQGLPFLVIGVLISSGIQLFLSPQSVVEKFPKNPVLGMILGLFSGFFLPVCDCASVPVFKSLLKKGVPPAVAICFLAASPVINPVVLISTYYAFGFQWSAVFWRTGLGLICGLLIGISFWKVKVEEILLEKERFYGNECGVETQALKEVSPIFLWFLHSRREFFQVVPYLMGGILLSSVFQSINLEWLQNFGQENLIFSIVALMALGFLLSLCSSSDGVVARGMEQIFPRTAIYGFLVFGPMMDLKNLFMLKGYVRTKFILRLSMTMFLICFLVLCLCSSWIGGGLR